MAVADPGKVAPTNLPTTRIGTQGGLKGPVGVLRLRLPDEVYGARAAGSVFAGDLDEAAEALELAPNRYLVGFFLRLALVVPSVSGCLARRLAGQQSGDREQRSIRKMRSPL